MLSHFLGLSVSFLFLRIEISVFPLILKIISLVNLVHILHVFDISLSLETSTDQVLINYKAVMSTGKGSAD